MAGNQRWPVENKIFVGGLSQQTTTDSLNRHFSKYGQADAIVMMDKTTGRSRGFGFCTFATPEAVSAALEQQQYVDGKEVQCAPCWEKTGMENKIFIGGLGESTTSESLNSHFAQYGEATAIVMIDKATSRSRGFGFCTFASREVMMKVLASPQVVDGKPVECRVCQPKGEQVLPPSSFQASKVFVGGLPQSCDEEKLRSYFKQFGVITDVTIMTDKETGRSRGFGYITFEDHRSVELALANRTTNMIDDKWVQVKRCMPKPQPTGAGGKGSQTGLAHMNSAQLAQFASITAQLNSMLGNFGMQVQPQAKGGCDGKGGFLPNGGGCFANSGGFLPNGGCFANGAGYNAKGASKGSKKGGKSIGYV
eukprot:TRINITY_DN11234_c0_g1_i2.p1 TRINITY_DN11234_c0_g1~~TRINITY_DN11234_c0_g1_i2.p1  ORF type:complete len:365 (-),score=100.60 TRINITY_DN11234_c0_g1_i2:51-1145(-)